MRASSKGGNTPAGTGVLINRHENKKVLGRYRLERRRNRSKRRDMDIEKGSGK